MSGEQESYSSESFMDDEPSSLSKNERERGVGDNNGRVGQTVPLMETEEEERNKESFVSAVENLAEVSYPVSSPEGDPEHVGTCMSTIEEESKSCYESSTTAPSASCSHKRVVKEGHERVASREPVEATKSGTKDLDISAELKEFEHLVNETAAGLKLNEAQPPSKDVVSNPPIDDHPHVEELLKRLDQLHNTQDILERVLDSDGALDADQLNAWINQFPTPIRSSIVNAQDDHSERSISAEIASIQKIVDAGRGLEMIDTSNSLNSEVAGGNNLLSPTDPFRPSSTVNTDRAVEDVLREYEELERSYSRASALDESFRSDISSLPPLSTYSVKEDVLTRTVPSAAPVIKPPVLKSVVAPTSSPSAATNNPLDRTNNNTDMIPPYPPPFSQRTSTKETGGSRSSRTKPMPASKSKVEEKSRTARVDGSPKSVQAFKPQHSQHTHTARSTTSLPTSSRDNTQDAYKPRNRRMRSPRTVVSPRMSGQTGPLDSRAEAQTGAATFKAGAGENYHHHGVPNEPPQPQKTDLAVTEALKTIQRLSTMVERQETLLEAYSKDNEKLWTQLKDAKAESQEKEANFQDVINSLRTELATLKLNQLVKTSSKANSNTQTQGVLSPPVYNKVDLERLREDAEMKSQQLMELRKEVLLLQSKLSEKQSKAPVSKPSTGGGVSALVFHEKEKEYQKEVTALKKQVRTLQKILYSKDSTAPPSQQQQTTTGGTRMAAKPMQRTKSDISKPNINANPHQALIKSIRNTGVDANAVFPKRLGSVSPKKGVNMNSCDIIHASLQCMDQEREEFEKIIEEKNKLIFEKERTILNLKEQVESLKSQLPDGDVVEHGLVDELRSRIITQNKAIQTLKEHLSTFKKLEAENLLLREDKRLLEQQVHELRRKLDFAQHLVKPENEVLCLLSEKVDELNSRYHHRERQLDTLLSKLTLKTTGGGCGAGVITSSNSSSSSSGGRPLTTNLSPRRIPLSQFSNNNDSLGGPAFTIGKGRPSSEIISADILHMADFSPTNSFQYNNYVLSDLPEM